MEVDRKKKGEDRQTLLLRIETFFHLSQNGAYSGSRAVLGGVGSAASPFLLTHSIPPSPDAAIAEPLSFHRGQAVAEALRGPPGL